METFEVRKPPGNATLTPEQTVRLICASWYELKGRGTPPDKFVVLIDADANARTPALAAKPFEEAIANLADIPAVKLVAVAVRHLEAWFFAHAEVLREFLGRAPGQVDTSHPDEIDNPKFHLINLLQSRSRVYTARVAEQIAARIDPSIVQGRSPSFADFTGKLRNGAPLSPLGE
jgi:hypothetical protein